MTMFKPISRQSLLALAGLIIALVASSAALIVYPLAFNGSSFMTLSGYHMSFRWFNEALNREWLGALTTSFSLGLAAALLAIAIAAPAAFARAHGRPGFMGFVVDLGALTLLVVPPISLAVGYFRAYGEGSWAGLLLGHTSLAFPFAYFSLLVGFRKLDPEMQEAGELLGASPWSFMAWVALPASRAYVFLGLLLGFLVSWDESVLSVFITGPTMETLPKLTWETMQRERDLTAAAINGVVAPLLVVAVLSLFAPTRRQGLAP